MTTPLLEIRDLDAGYDRTQVLRGVTLRLEEGGRLGIFGPNGHGKSTLLGAISGLVPPWSGVIAFAGASITGHSPQDIVERGLVHVTQGNALFPDMTVLETLRLAAWTRRARRSARATLATVFELFPRLAERRSQPARTLSGGERQMVSIGMGLMAAPRLLMIDEPSLGLSPKVKEEVGRAIVGICGSGASVIVVEQDIEFLRTMTRSAVLLDHGTIAASFPDLGQIGRRDIIGKYFGTDAG